MEMCIRDRRATELQKEKGYTFAHPFNDVDVMAGQGTIGLEIMEQLKDVDAVVVPCLLYTSHPPLQETNHRPGP